MDDKESRSRGEHCGLVDLAAAVFLGWNVPISLPSDDSPAVSEPNGHFPDDPFPPSAGPNDRHPDADLEK